MRTYLSEDSEDEDNVVSVVHRGALASVSERRATQIRHALRDDPPDSEEDTPPAVRARRGDRHPFGRERRPLVRDPSRENAISPPPRLSSHRTGRDANRDRHVVWRDERGLDGQGRWDDDERSAPRETLRLRGRDARARRWDALPRDRSPENTRARVETNATPPCPSSNRSNFDSRPNPGATPSSRFAETRDLAGFDSGRSPASRDESSFEAPRRVASLARRFETQLDFPAFRGFPSASSPSEWRALRGVEAAREALDDIATDLRFACERSAEQIRTLARVVDAREERFALSASRDVPRRRIDVIHALDGAFEGGCEAPARDDVIARAAEPRAAETRSAATETDETVPAKGTATPLAALETAAIGRRDADSDSQYASNEMELSEKIARVARKDVRVGFEIDRDFSETTAAETSAAEAPWTTGIAGFPGSTATRAEPDLSLWRIDRAEPELEPEPERIERFQTREKLSERLPWKSPSVATFEVSSVKTSVGSLALSRTRKLAPTASTIKRLAIGQSHDAPSVTDTPMHARSTILGLARAPSAAWPTTETPPVSERTSGPESLGPGRGVCAAPRVRDGARLSVSETSTTAITATATNHSLWRGLSRTRTLGVDPSARGSKTRLDCDGAAKPVDPETATR